jgi:hypothetical protein
MTPLRHTVKTELLEKSIFPATHQFPENSIFQKHDFSCCRAKTKKWTFSVGPKSLLFQISSFQDEKQTKTPHKISSFYLNIVDTGQTSLLWHFQPLARMRRAMRWRRLLALLVLSACCFAVKVRCAYFRKIKPNCEDGKRWRRRV